MVPDRDDRRLLLTETADFSRATLPTPHDFGVRTIEYIGGNVEIVEVEITEDVPVAGKRLDGVRNLMRG